MRIQYLGTAASEGWPAVFCQCEPCRRARRLGGKNIRHRSSSVINGSLVIDMPPDLFSQALALGVDLSQIKHFVITHAHGDHFYPNELFNAYKPFAHVLDGIPLRLYGSRTVMERARRLWADAGEEERQGPLESVEVRAFEPFVAAGCTVTPLPANHGAGVSFIYFVESDGKALLYAHDTGWLLNEVWAFLRGRRLDFVSMDGTSLDGEWYEHHMRLDENIALKEKLTDMGSASGNTVFVSNHFSHNGCLLHHEIEERLLPHGIAVAFDGLELEF